MSNIGDRVGAVYGCKKDSKTIEFFGYGTYEGLHIPVEAVGFWADCMRDAKAENPRIRLDDGSCVYGCECWWGTISAVEEMMEGREVVYVDINKIREEFLREKEEEEQQKKLDK